MVRLRPLIYVLAVPVVLAAAACGGDIGGDVPRDGGLNELPPLVGLKSLKVTPAIVTVTVDGDTPATADFTAIGTFDDGHTEDVTKRVGWFIVNAAIGGFQGAHFTSSTYTGGHTQVYARGPSSDVQSDPATLTVILKKRVSDPDSTGLPTDPGSKFGGAADASRAPDVVYPNDGVLLPPNLGIIEVHFKPGAQNTLFELDFTNDVTDVRIYAKCAHPLGGGCVYTPQGGVWTWLSSTNAGGQPVMVTVKGTDDAGAKVGTSSAVAMSFSKDPINGGIYYWTTYNNSVIMRFDFAGSAAKAEQFVGGDIVDGNCVGCHALSADGKKMVAEVNGRNDGKDIIINVEKVTALADLGTTEKSIFESWNPDASMYVGVYGDRNATDFNLLLMDGTTGKKVGHVDVGATKQGNAADHPDWSPDGTRIAFTQIGADSDSLQRQYQGAIRMATQNGSAWTVDTLVDHGPPGTNHYYPAFSPESGELLVFDTSQCDTAANSQQCDGDTDPSAKLFIMQPVKGAKVIELANANAPGKGDGGATKLTNTYPKWSPFVFMRTGESGSRLMWLTFSSTRYVGLRPPPPPGPQSSSSNTAGTYLWMTAIDPAAAKNGFDPSSPAFYLPFQDMATSNHIAQWTKSVRPRIP